MCQFNDVMEAAVGMLLFSVLFYGRWHNSIIYFTHLKLFFLYFIYVLAYISFFLFLFVCHMLFITIYLDCCVCLQLKEQYCIKSYLYMGVVRLSLNQSMRNTESSGGCWKSQAKAAVPPCTAVTAKEKKKMELTH